MEPIEKALLGMFPPIAVSFFALFSRFECALKREGYVIGDGVAGANWDRFANELGKSFYKQARKSGKCDTLIKSPPKRQVVANGQLGWEPPGAVTNVQELFGAVSRVRHNLFHGGKFPDGLVPGSERDERLLEEACWILWQAASKNERLQYYLANPMA